MSVVIKDMRFPNYCSECEFSCPWWNDGTYCSRHPERESVKYGEEKPEWCPLRDVPTPNGRLIDADALMGRIEHDTPLSSTFEKVVRRYIENAPTIIEAEE